MYYFISAHYFKTEELHECTQANIVTQQNIIVNFYRLNQCLCTILFQRTISKL